MATPSTHMRIIHGIPLYPNEAFAGVEPELLTELVEHQLVEIASSGRGGSVMWIGDVVCEFSDKDGLVPIERIRVTPTQEEALAAQSRRVELLDVLRSGTKKGAGGKAVAEMMARQSQEHVRRLRDALESAPMTTIMLFDQT